MISNVLTPNSSSFDLASPSAGGSIYPESPMTPQRHQVHHRHYHARHSGAAVPAHGIHHPAAALAAATANGGRIDQTKAKTKMCRNFLLGIACPFEDRCAFAHGTTEIRANMAKAAAAAAGLSESPDSVSSDSALHSPRVDDSSAAAPASDDFAVMTSVAPVGPYVSPAAAVAAATAAGPLAPPSYEAFVYSANGAQIAGGHHALLDSPFESRSATPPAYPTRYRFNPYSEFGIVFEA